MKRQKNINLWFGDLKMLYQPENFDDCIEIKCKKCIMTKTTICLRTLKVDSFYELTFDTQSLIISNYINRNKSNCQNCNGTGFIPTGKICGLPRNEPCPNCIGV